MCVCVCVCVQMYIAEGREGEGDERPVGKRLKFAVESEFRGPVSVSHSQLV